MPFLSVVRATWKRREPRVYLGYNNLAAKDGKTAEEIAEMFRNTSAEGNQGGAARKICRIGEFELDLQLRTLSRNGEGVRLSARPFSTLIFLVENRNRVISKPELLEKVWGGQREVSTVEHAVGQIRDALGDDKVQPRYIETIPGQGYRFVAEVQAHEATQPARQWKPLAYAASAFLILCAVGASAFRLLRFGEASQAPLSLNVARVTVDANGLTAWSAGGLLWTRRFDESAGGNATRGVIVAYPNRGS